MTSLWNPGTTSTSSNYDGAPSGTANAININVTPNPTAYSEGVIYYFKAAFSNTGAATLAVNSLAAIPFTDHKGNALAANAIIAGYIYGIIIGTNGASALLFSESDLDVFKTITSQLIANTATLAASTVNTVVTNSVKTVGYYTPTVSGTPDGGVNDWVNDTTDTSSGAIFTASASGTTLTVTAMSAGNGGALAVNQRLFNNGVLTGTYISSFGTGTGGVGTYILNKSQNLNSGSMTASDGGSLIVDLSGRRWKSLLVEPVDIRKFGAVNDGVTANDAPIAAMEVSGIGTFFVGEGVYLSSYDPKTLRKTYVGPGTLSFSGVQRIAPGQQRYGSSLKVNQFIGNTAQIDAAIRNGAATVVYVGTSIPQGLSNIAYEDSSAGLLAKQLRLMYPNVAWTFVNLSISGSSAWHLNDANYVGGANNTPPAVYPAGAGTFNFSAGAINVAAYGTPNRDLWPSGQTNGISWIGHIQAQTPDLVFVDFGANETGQASNFFAIDLNGILTKLAAFTKPPSVALVSTMLPTRLTVPWSGYQQQLIDIANVTRGVAYKNNVTLCDLNRVYRYYRDGVDILNYKRKFIYTFQGWPTGYQSLGTLPTVSGTYNLTFTGTATTVYQKFEQDVHLFANFFPNAPASTPIQLIYRQQDLALSNPNIGYVAQAFMNGATPTLGLYFNQVQITSAVVPAFGANTQLEVIATGCRHQVFLNGVKYIDVYDFSSATLAGITYNCTTPGQFGVNMQGAGVVSNFANYASSDRVVEAIQANDNITYGTVNDFGFPVNPTGVYAPNCGDGVHHPSTTTAAWAMDAYQPLLDHFAAIYSQMHPQAVLAIQATETVTAIAAGDYMTITVAGVGPANTPISNVANGFLADTFATIIAAQGHNPVPVVVKKNGATTIFNTSLTLPTNAGNWLVTARYVMSSSGATIRNSLDIQAIRVT